MNSKQVNRKEMQDAVVSFLDGNPEKWNPVAKIVEAKTRLSEINQQIETAQAEQEASKVSVGKNKKQVKNVISVKADILNDIVEAYAGMNNMPELESKMATSASDLVNLRNEDFVVKVREVITGAENHQETLVAEYGMTANQVTDLKADLDQFLAMRGLPTVYRISSKQATADLESLFTQANEVLTTRLDKLMKIFKRRDPNFYNGYLAARVIVDN